MASILSLSEFNPTLRAQLLNIANLDDQLAEIKRKIATDPNVIASGVDHHLQQTAHELTETLQNLRNDINNNMSNDLRRIEGVHLGYVADDTECVRCLRILREWGCYKHPTVFYRHSNPMKTQIIAAATACGMRALEESTQIRSVGDDEWKRVKEREMEDHKNPFDHWRARKD